MTNKLVYLATAALMFAGTALADADVISVTIEYDASQLETAEGAKSVKRSIREQAREACEYNKSPANVSRDTGIVDESCARGVIRNAIAAIQAKHSVDGASLPREFAEL